MKVMRIIQNPYTGFVFNLVYALCNSVVGIVTHSWWLITIGACFSVFAATRFSVLQIRRKAKGDFEIELFAKRVTGVLLIVLTVCLVGVNILAFVKDRGIVYNKIVMIAIATYTFTKVTIAIIRMVQSKHIDSPTIKTLRNISLADAFVSVYALQRSMLVSFPGMNADGILIFNILTGTAVCIAVLLLGINLIGGKHVNMAKSKIVKANNKIADAVTSGYKKIEKGVVGGYTKIEDKFVEAYLTKDGETVEEAKARLKKENKR